MPTLKHLQTFENFISPSQASPDVSYVRGDKVKVKHDGGEVLAQIMDVKAQNAFVVCLIKDSTLLPERIVKDYDEIVAKVDGVDSPAMNSDIIDQTLTKTSNDLVINNYPKTI